MLSNSKNIAVNPENCVDNDCVRNCGKPECNICLTCIDSESVSEFHRAFREHKRIGGFKRIFPSRDHFNEEFINRLTRNNQISVKWFKEKCQENNEWC